MLDKIFNRKKMKRDKIMQRVKEATERGECVILGETRWGATVVVVCKSKPLVIQQAEEILKGNK